MKKVLTLLLALLVVCGLFVGCGSKKEAAEQSKAAVALEASAGEAALEATLAAAAAVEASAGEAALKASSAAASAAAEAALKAAAAAVLNFFVY